MRQANRFFIAVKKLMAKYDCEYTNGIYSFDEGQLKIAVTHIDQYRVISSPSLNSSSDNEDQDD